MTDIVKIYLRAGHFRGGNSIDDVLELAKLGPSWFEMDFRLNSQGVLLSGHDEDTYAKVGGPILSDITDPSEIRNGRGGRCTTLKGALEQMAHGSRLFIDLKSTWFRAQAQSAVEAAAHDILSCGRSDEAVVMVYTPHARMCTKAVDNVSFCLKQINNKYAEKDTLGFIDLASKIGAKYMCAPVSSTFRRFAPACHDANIRPIVPVWGKDKRDEILQHLDNGIRHFICNYKREWLDELYAEFLNTRGEPAAPELSL